MSEFNLNQFIGTESMTKMAQLQSYLEQELFLRPELGLTNREMNNWEAEGLFDNRRGKEQRWRRFNFIEFSWLKLVLQMRELGLPIPVIRKAKKWLMDKIKITDLMTLVFEIPELNDEVRRVATVEESAGIDAMLENKNWKKQLSKSKVIPLQLFITQVVLKNSPVSFAIFLDGDVIPILDATPLEESEKRTLNEPHIVVSLSFIIKDFLAGPLAPERMAKLHLLEPNEEKLLEIIHSGEYQSLNVTFRNSEMNSLELTNQPGTTRKVADILTDGKYSNIVVKTHKGMVATIENTLAIPGTPQ